MQMARGLWVDAVVVRAAVGGMKAILRWDSDGSLGSG